VLLRAGAVLLVLGVGMLLWRLAVHRRGQRWLVHSLRGP
jgi:hypothetical protein